MERSSPQKRNKHTAALYVSNCHVRIRIVDSWVLYVDVEFWSFRNDQLQENVDIRWTVHVPVKLILGELKVHLKNEICRYYQLHKDKLWSFSTVSWDGTKLMREVVQAKVDGKRNRDLSLIHIFYLPLSLSQEN